MISVTSVTDNYILQPSLFQKHKSTVEWLSATLFWKRELKFFQKLLDRFSPQFTSENDKKKVDHFQSIITYYNGELIDVFKSRLRQHEKHLAEMLHNKDEADTQYFKEHQTLMNDLDSIDRQLNEYKEEFYIFIETAMN
jgi:hypothetical protein